MKYYESLSADNENWSSLERYKIWFIYKKMLVDVQNNETSILAFINYIYIHIVDP